MREPIPTVLFFHTDHERPDSWNIHFLDRQRPELRLRDEGRKVEIRFEADVYGEGRNDTLEPGQDRVGTSEMIQEDDPAAATADAAHLARHADRVGHDADEIRGIH